MQLFITIIYTFNQQRRNLKQDRNDRVASSRWDQDLKHSDSHMSCLQASLQCFFQHGKNQLSLQLNDNNGDKVYRRFYRPLIQNSS